MDYKQRAAEIRSSDPGWGCGASNNPGWPESLRSGSGVAWG
jgi:hypothetical protein